MNRSTRVGDGDAPAADAEPDALFDRAWKDAVLAEAVARLRAEYAQEDRDACFRVFDALHLATGERPSHRDLAAQLSLSASDVSNFAARARTRYRAIVRRVVRESVSTEADGRDEMRRLFGEA